ncbi:hypothetical protein GCM10011513_24500 [Franconibacter daqui]|nr:hypothetical protein GCM10011513_24500 [Franconibacter daqui]
MLKAVGVNRKAAYANKQRSEQQQARQQAKPLSDSKMIKFHCCWSFPGQEGVRRTRTGDIDRKKRSFKLTEEGNADAYKVMR